MIRLENISVTFAKNTPLEHRALDSLNLDIKQGEFVTVIGNNGAGKSTLQAVVAGNVTPDSGSIIIDGKDISFTSVVKRTEYIARVFQDPRLGTCEQLTIEENMSLAFSRGKKRGLSFALSPDNRKYFQDKLSILGMGLENRINTIVGALSGGQRQALSLLMATLSPAKLLLLDEHTAALDPKMAEGIMQITKKLYIENKLTVLMITHNIKHAFEYGGRTIMLQEGKITRDLTGDERNSCDVNSILSVY
jgi:putative ABC transport system ATP-binding protein